MGLTNWRREKRRKSNAEFGEGRPDIRMKALKPALSHVVVEFKKGRAVERLSKEALQQILDKQYYAGLTGEVICIGLAHDKKKCALVHKILNV